MDDDALEVIRQAERIVWAAGWHLQEQSVLEELAGTPGLASVTVFGRFARARRCRREP